MICFTTILICYLFTCFPRLVKLDDIKNDNVHKLMNTQDLRRIFYVDSHDQVPEYEVLKLQVNPDEDGKLNEIVMKLSTFGKDYKLRLKRNVDFQQRIKDMKIFMAESTKDGQLRYTEIKSHQAAAQNQHNHQNQNQNQNSNINNNLNAKHTTSDDEVSHGSRREQVSEKSNNSQKTNIEPSPVSSSSPSPLTQSSPSSSPISASKPRSSSPDSSSASSPASSSPSSASASASANLTPSQPTNSHQQEQQPTKTDHASRDHSHWNIGSTYHDEDNLAALLIDHDRRTGQLRVDGTIGNDFVIKPIPQATIDALLLKGQQELLKDQAAATAEQLAATSRLGKLTPRANNNAIAMDSIASSSPFNTNPNSNSLLSSPSSASNLPESSFIDLERSATTSGNKSLSPQVDNNYNNNGNLETTAIHMHDDDPHDDDEMFLDEDEALELAHLHSAPMSDFNHTTARGSLFTGRTNQTMSLLASSQLDDNRNKQFSLPQPRALSKAASERKWKKYRKLMAQTQVPKPSALQSRNSNEDQQINKQSSSSASRARRHTNVHSKQKLVNEYLKQNQQQQQQTVPKMKTLQVAHHIVYRQKPSSEGSSREHQHSFMISPQDYSPASMEQFASSFSPQRLSKRSVNNDENNYEDMIENQTGNAPVDIIERLAQREAATSNRATLSGRGAFQDDSDADFLHDPMGGQFYLEPGSVTGFERAGYSDWSLINADNSNSNLNGASRRNFAPPPYALNNTSEAEVEGRHYTNVITSSSNSLLATNSTNLNLNNYSNNSNNRRRLKRQTQSSGAHHRMGVRSSSSSQVRRKRQAPDTVWPEVLLVVDYDSFLLHGGDSRDVKRYFVSFWNGVDLRYKLLYHPKIRISLAGMIVAKDRDATPYLERNRLRAPNADAVDAAGALTDMGKYLYREDRLPTYDLAVVITKLDMCRRRYEGGRCNRGTAGFAYVGGACVVNKRLEKVNSVAIIEDSGGFSGIIVAAHEVGHLLGCVHDGSPPPSYLGGPGATHCPWEDGFIMSDLRHTERGFKWSGCSIEQFKHFLNGETATCLYNYPHESQMLHRLLPGTMLSLDEQCKRDRGTNACFKDARVCAQLFCFDSASGYCVSYRPAAEGSPCGEGQVCRNGKCIGEIENIIPDYTQQLQTVVAARRPSSHSSVSRSAYNGLSTSATSTATTSPHSKLPPVSVPTNRRMDTFQPLIRQLRFIS